MENPYESPETPCSPESDLPADEAPGHRRWRAKPHVAWAFLAAWHIPFLVWMACVVCSFWDTGPFSSEPKTVESIVKSSRLVEMSFEIICIVQGYLLALFAFALILSARLRRFVFRPEVTYADVRGALWGNAVLWTVLPTIGVVAHIAMFR